jgi:penicillin-binding protein 1C
VPAVKLLDAVGPARLMVRFRRAEVRPVLPPNEAPGLAIGLGGVGITLKDLVQLYAASPIAASRSGSATACIREPARQDRRRTILDPVAVWQIADILSGVIPPAGAVQRGIAYKTGTSYGYRDAWSVGYDGRYVLGVWVGRPDNGAVPGPDRLWHGRADPVRGLCQIRVATTPLPRAPARRVRIAQAELPISQRFSLSANGSFHP